MEPRALVHDKGLLISAAATAIPALGKAPRSSQIPSTAADVAQGWGPQGAVAAKSWHGNPTALSNMASLCCDSYPSPKGPQHPWGTPQISQDSSSPWALRAASSQMDAGRLLFDGFIPPFKEGLAGG